MKNSNLVTLQVNGPDQKGIFTQLCNYLFEQRINIMDVAQNVLQGYLSITFLLDVSSSYLNHDRVELEIKKIARQMNLNTNIYEYIEGNRPKVKNLYIFTFMGSDQIGILAKLSAILAEEHANIETIDVQVRGGWIYVQCILDLSFVEEIDTLRNELRNECQQLGLSMVLQQERVYRRNKKLIAFDMDSTLVQQETIVEIAKHVNKEKEMAEATNRAMENNVNFEQSLRSRSKLLAGIELSTVMEVADDLTITPGAEELIHHIKQMGWKIAIISSGFSIFTDAIKKKLNIDYAFGNTLEIVDDVLTGNVQGDIIDGEGKWELVNELATQLGITREEVVTVGDGSNDTLMLKNSGLGIGLNSKEIASEVADGRVTLNDVNMILLMLGLSDTEITEILQEHKS